LELGGQVRRRRQTVTNLPLAVALQGIDVFDGFWGNISIMHNIALVSNNTGSA
jgi:hypothetical protein